MTTICAVIMVCLPTYSVVATHLVDAPGEPWAMQEENPILLAFNEAGEILLSGERVTWDELGRRLDALTAAGETKTVLLSGDENASYGFSLRLRAFVEDHGVKVKELVRGAEE